MKTTPASCKASSSPGFDSRGGLKITQPAIVAIVAYSVLCILVLLPIDLEVWDEKTQKYVKQKYNFWTRLLLLFLLLFPYILSIYSLNCMMVGGCDVWSWVVGIVTIVWSFVVVAYAFYDYSFRVDDVLP